VADLTNLADWPNLNLKLATAGRFCVSFANPWLLLLYKILAASSLFENFTGQILSNFLYGSTLGSQGTEFVSFICRVSSLLNHHQIRQQNLAFTLSEKTSTHNYVSINTPPYMKLNKVPCKDQIFEVSRISNRNPSNLRNLEGAILNTFIMADFLRFP